jgi:hypothetical protein
MGITAETTASGTSSVKAIKWVLCFATQLLGKQMQ